MTDDLEMMIRQWLDICAPDMDGKEQLAQWIHLLQGLTPYSEQFSDPHAALLARMTQQSIEWSRFAQSLMPPASHTEPLSQSHYLEAFQDYMQQQTRLWLLQRWGLPEQFSQLLEQIPQQNPLVFDNPLLKGLNQLLDVSPEKLGRTQHQQFKKTLTLLNEHQTALNAYSQHYQAINQEALSCFHAGLEQEDEPITELESLHRLWTEAYERIYQEHLLSSDYQVCLGRLHNAQLQLRLNIQEQRNLWLSQQGIASEAALNLAFQQLHQLRKQMREMRQEMQQLKQQVHEKSNA